LQVPTNDVTVDAAVKLERESWLDAARDVIGVADVTEARGMIEEPRPYLDDAATSRRQELTTGLRLNGRQRWIPEAH